MLNKVGGNVGININGNAVIIPTVYSALQNGGLGKVLASKAIVKAGDYIFDNTSNTYKKVSSALAKTTVTAASTLTTILSSASTVKNAMEPLQMVSFSAPMAPLPPNSYQFYTTENSYDQQRANLQAQLNQYSFKQKLFSTSLVYDGGNYKMGLTTITGNIGVSGNFSGCWSSVSVQGNLSALILIDDVLGVTTTKTTNLSNFNYPFPNIPICTGYFMVGPIPMGWQFSLTSGVKGSINLTNTSTLGIKSCLSLGGGGSANLGLWNQTFSPSSTVDKRTFIINQ